MSQGFCPHCSHPLPPGSAACPHCGKPVTGAPGDRGTKLVLGLVLGAGCLVLLLFVGGIVAAIVIPNFLDAVQRAKQKRTMADMRVLAVALESFHADRGAYPGVESIEEVVGQLGAHGWTGEPATDGWDHPLRWGCWESEGDGCVSYELVSPGRDGVFEPTDGGYEPGAFPANDYDADIALSDGMFSRWPEGAGRLGAGG